MLTAETNNSVNRCNYAIAILPCIRVIRETLNISVSANCQGEIGFLKESAQNSISKIYRIII